MPKMGVMINPYAHLTDAERTAERDHLFAVYKRLRDGEIEVRIDDTEGRGVTYTRADMERIERDLSMLQQLTGTASPRRSIGIGFC